MDELAFPPVSSNGAILDLLIQKNFCHPSYLPKYKEIIALLENPDYTAFEHIVSSRKNIFPSDGDFARHVEAFARDPKLLKILLDEYLGLMGDTKQDLFSRLLSKCIKHSIMSDSDVNLSTQIRDVASFVHQTSVLIDEDTVIALDMKRQPQITYATLDVLADEYSSLKYILDHSSEPLHDIRALSTGFININDFKEYYRQGFKYCPDQKGRLSNGDIEFLPDSQAQRLYDAFARVDKHPPFHMQDLYASQLTILPKKSRSEVLELLDLIPKTPHDGRCQVLMQIVLRLNEDRRCSESLLVALNPDDIQNPSHNAALWLQDPSLAARMMTNSIEC